MTLSKNQGQIVFWEILTIKDDYHHSLQYHNFEEMYSHWLFVVLLHLHLMLEEYFLHCQYIVSLIHTKQKKNYSVIEKDEGME